MNPHAPIISFKYYQFMASLFHISLTTSLPLPPEYFEANPRNQMISSVNISLNLSKRLRCLSSFFNLFQHHEKINLQDNKGIKMNQMLTFSFFTSYPACEFPRSRLGIISKAGTWCLER